MIVRVNERSLRIHLASPEQIQAWAERHLPNGDLVGLIKKPYTIHYRTQKPEKDGLFCERIFGPIKAGTCACGKYERNNSPQADSQTIPYCDQCGVEFMDTQARRHRMGYIHLACPVIHIWYFLMQEDLFSLLFNLDKKLDKKLLTNLVNYKRCLLPPVATTPRLLNKTGRAWDAPEKYKGFFRFGRTLLWEIARFRYWFEYIYKYSPQPWIGRYLDSRLPLLPLERIKVRRRKINRRRRSRLTIGIFLYEQKEAKIRRLKRFLKMLVKKRRRLVKLRRMFSMFRRTYSPKRWIDRSVNRERPSRKKGIHLKRKKISVWQIVRPIAWGMRESYKYVPKAIIMIKDRKRYKTKLKGFKEASDSLADFGDYNLKHYKEANGVVCRTNLEPSIDRLDWYPIHLPYWTYHRSWAKLKRFLSYSYYSQVADQEILSGAQAIYRWLQTVNFLRLWDTDRELWCYLWDVILAQSDLIHKQQEEVRDLSTLVAWEETSMRSIPTFLEWEKRRIRSMPMPIFFNSQKWQKTLLLLVGCQQDISLKTKLYDYFWRLDKLHTKAQKLLRRYRRQLKKLYRTTSYFAKRMFYLRQMLHSYTSRPEWTIIRNLPVLPPDLRPVVQLPHGLLVRSDLNELYRLVIQRNNALLRAQRRHLCDKELVKHKRGLQEAVNALLWNRGTIRDKKKIAYKSLSDIIHGKKGRFRENLLGKRVDYSGRSVITVGPQLALHQCGLPREMALELLQPFVMRTLIYQQIAKNSRQAKRIIQVRPPMLWPVLRELAQDHIVVLNRAPTLHRLGVQAFEPILIPERAIQLHPLVCAGFNADFDGDQMAVHVPLSWEAQAEAYIMMCPYLHVLSPATGHAIVAPSQDMLLGLYLFTLDSTIGVYTHPKLPEKAPAAQYFSSLACTYGGYIVNCQDPTLEARSTVWICFLSLSKLVNKENQTPLATYAILSLDPDSLIESQYSNQGIRLDISQYHEDKWDRDGQWVTQYIRTTLGRILLNTQIAEVQFAGVSSHMYLPLLSPATMGKACG